MNKLDLLNKLLLTNFKRAYDCQSSSAARTNLQMAVSRLFWSGLGLPGCMRAATCKLEKIWPRDWSQRLGNGRGIHGGRFSGPGDHSGPTSNHFRRFRARPTICDLNIVTLPQLRFLRHQHCLLRQHRCLLLQQRTCLLLGQDRCLLLRLEQKDLATIESSETSTLCVACSSKREHVCC